MAPDTTSSVAHRSLLRMTGAAGAFLLAGSAHGSVQSETGLSVSLSADANGDVWGLAMTTGGDLVRKSFASWASAHAFLNSPGPGYVQVAYGASSIALMFLVSADIDTTTTGTPTVVLTTTRVAAGALAGGQVATNGGGTYAKLAAGDTIGSALGFSSSAVLTLNGAGWSGAGYIGFYLTPDGGTTKTYGWIQFTGTGVGTATISGYGWEDVPNTSLLAGATGSGGGGGGAGGGSPAGGTPEPAASGLALLALGAAGVMRHKRRKAA